MIRYDKKTLNQIKRIVNNYNRRVERISNQDKYGNYYIPEKINVSEIIELDNKININRKLRDLQSYNKKSAEQIVTKNGKSLSLYEYNLRKKYRDILRRNINKELKFYEKNYAQTRGRKESYSLARSGDRNYLNLIAKKTRLLKKDIFETDYETLYANTKQKDLNQWQNNYIKMLEDIAQTFNISGYDKIVNNLKKMNVKDFDKLTKVERTVQQIIYYYKTISDVGVNYAVENFSSDIQNLFDVLNIDIENIINELK